jgi:hypothetical protein
MRVVLGLLMGKTECLENLDIDQLAQPHDANLGQSQGGTGIQKKDIGPIFFFLSSGSD